MAEPSPNVQARPQDPQALIREATLILKEPLEAMAGPLRTYRKRIQVGKMESLAIRCSFYTLFYTHILLWN